MRSPNILRILTIGALCAVLTAADRGAPPTTAGSTRLRLVAPSPTLEPAGDGRRVIPRVAGFGSVSRAGAPMLPLRILLVAIPEGSVPRLQVLSELSAPLAPIDVAPVPRVRVRERLERPRGAALHSRPGQSGAGARGRAGGGDDGLQDYDDDFEADPVVFGEDREFPEQAVRLGNIGYLREQRYVEVLFSPVLYNPAQHSARHVSETEAEIVFDMPPGAPAFEPAPFRPDPLFEDTYRASLANYEQGKLFRVGPGSSAPATAEALLSPTGSSATAALTTAATGAPPRYKLFVSKSGVYRLDYTYLQTNAPDLLALDPRTLLLTAEGVEVPIAILDAAGNPGEADGWTPGDYLEFYGQPKREPPTLLNYDFGSTFPNVYQANDYTDTQVYWLTSADPAGSHLRIPSRSGAPVLGLPVATDFQDSAMWDENNLYLPLEGNDPFFSIPSLVAGSTQSTRDISLALPGLASLSGTESVTVRLRGGSDIAASNPDHRTRVWVNGDTGGGADFTWDGEVIATSTFNEAQSVLTNPTTVHFSAPGIAGVSLDKSYLDTVTINYRRTFAAAGDALLFSYPNQGTRFQVSGFSGPPAAIYEVSRTLSGSLEADPVRITGAAASGSPTTTYTLDVPLDTSAGAPATRTFIATGPAGPQHPDAIIRAADPVLSDPANAADIIVIAARGTVDPTPGGALDALLAWRLSSQGLTSKLVYIDQVYDEFGHGLRDVNAIRAFLSYAFDNWKGPSGTARPVSFVLLVGDASADYKDTLKNTPSGAFWVDQVPTQMMFEKNSILGYYSSDNWLASFRGTDQIPDVFLGRISTRNATDAAAVFDKIRRYEQTPTPGLWKGHATLLTSDGKVPGESDTFEAVQNNLASRYFSIPPYSVPSPSLYFAEPPWNATDLAGFKTAFINDLQSGASVMSYVGHGSFDTLGLTTFFTTQDARSLTNGTVLPLMVNVDCLAGGFHYLNATESVGEGMINNPNGGAVAAFAPSGLSNVFVGDVVAPTLFDSLFGIDRDRLLAPATTALRTALWNQGSISDLQGFTFLGDPATSIATPSPPPPSGLAAAAGNDQVTLSWTPPSSPVAGTRIYRATSAAGPYASVACDVLTSTSCADRTVINATTYYYYAVSIDSEGFWGHASNDNADCDAGPGCVKARPVNPGPPAVPTGLAVHDPGTGGTLSATWLANTERDLKTYNLHYGVVPGQYTTTLSYPATITSALIPGLTDSVRYYFALTATNTSGNESALSAEVSQVPHLIQGIAPPRAISDLMVSRSGNDLVLSWSQPLVDIYGRPTTVVSYNIYAGSVPNYVATSSLLIGTNAGGSNTTFRHVGAVGLPGNLDYVVTAVDSNGLVSGAGRELPSGIGNLAVSLVTASPLVVRLTWPAVVNDMQGLPTIIDHYQIYRSSTPIPRGGLGPSTLFRDNVTTLSTDLDLTGLSGPSYLSVIAVDNRGNLSPF